MKRVAILLALAVTVAVAGPKKRKRIERAEWENLAAAVKEKPGTTMARSEAIEHLCSRYLVTQWVKVVDVTSNGKRVTVKMWNRWEGDFEIGAPYDRSFALWKKWDRVQLLCTPQPNGVEWGLLVDPNKVCGFPRKATTGPELPSFPLMTGKWEAWEKAYLGAASEKKWDVALAMLKAATGMCWRIPGKSTGDRIVLDNKNEIKFDEIKPQDPELLEALATPQRLQISYVFRPDPKVDEASIEMNPVAFYRFDYVVTKLGD